MKKIVIFGGGSGLSQLLKGLKLFPIDVTAVVSVSDNGRSTGRLRKDYNIPAVGDITKVLLSMSECSNEIKDLMNYRFTKSKTLGNHSIKNLLLTALLDLKGDFASSLPILVKLLDIKGNVLPLTEDNVDLVGITSEGKRLIGEEQITKTKKHIERICYSDEITVNPKVIDAVKKADLIIFSSGSLITSIIPHLLDSKLNNAIKNSKAKTMYVCNLFTQPGETDDYTVSNHIELLEEYLGKNSIDIVVANNTKMNSALVKKYETEEQKDQVILDLDNLEKMNKKVIADKLYKIEENYYRHDELKTAYVIFSYLMDGIK
ncbi:MAG: YvcK family protein [Bacilli bacterium]|nr:YvcK family protein [Bacilli bacterium]